MRKGVKTVKAVKKIVKREIARASENKIIYDRGNQRIIGSGNNSFIDSSILPVSPGVNANMNITSGTTRVGRVGNKVTTRSHSASVIYYPVPYDAVNNPVPVPQILDVYLFYDKQNPTGFLSGSSTPPTPAANGDFFYIDGNTSGTTGFSNNLGDHEKMPNTSRYRVFWKKTYKIGYASAGGLGTNPAGEFYSNNDFKFTAEDKYDLKKHYVKTVTYPDGTTPFPRNHGLWLLFVAMRADGGSSAGGGDTQLRVTYKVPFVYEDM